MFLQIHKNAYVVWLAWRLPVSACTVLRIIDGCSVGDFSGRTAVRGGGIYTKGLYKQFQLCISGTHLHEWCMGTPAKDIEHTPYNVCVISIWTFIYRLYISLDKLRFNTSETRSMWK